MRIYIYICNVYIYICVCVNIYVYICVCVNIYICMYVCMHVCMYVYIMYICVLVCVCVCTCVEVASYLHLIEHIHITLGFNMLQPRYTIMYDLELQHTSTAKMRIGLTSPWPSPARPSSRNDWLQIQMGPVMPMILVP